MVLATSTKKQITAKQQSVSKVSHMHMFYWFCWFHPLIYFKWRFLSIPQPTGKYQTHSLTRSRVIKLCCWDAASVKRTRSVFHLLSVALHLSWCQLGHSELASISPSVSARMGLRPAASQLMGRNPLLGRKAVMIGLQLLGQFFSCLEKWDFKTTSQKCLSHLFELNVFSFILTTLALQFLT